MLLSSNINSTVKYKSVIHRMTGSGNIQLMLPFWDALFLACCPVKNALRWWGSHGHGRLVHRAMLSSSLWVLFWFFLSSKLQHRLRTKRGLVLSCVLLYSFVFFEFYYASMYICTGDPHRGWPDGGDRLIGTGRPIWKCKRNKVERNQVSVDAEASYLLILRNKQ